MITITGKIMHEIEMHTSKDGKQYCNLTIASRASYKDNPEDKYRHTDFFDCKVFGKGAEFFERFRAKGDIVTVVGEMHARDVTKDGTTKRYWSVTVRDSEGINSYQSEKGAEDLGQLEQIEPELEVIDDGDLPF